MNKKHVGSNALDMINGWGPAMGKRITARMRKKKRVDKGYDTKEVSIKIDK